MNGNVLDIVGLKKYFELKKDRLFSKPKYVRAVDGVTFSVGEREVFGLVGETGCGKTTIGRLVVRLERPTEGSIFFQGTDIAGLAGGELKKFRRKMQMIFQDPYASLNPRMTVSQWVVEPLRNYQMGTPEEMADRTLKALEDAGLRPVEEYLERFPHELSGGERQRVSIARALVVDPAFIVADEPVSMLDVSIRAGVMQLLLGLREKYGMAFILITHDISVARYMSDRMAVMYLGKIVEMADTEGVIKEPLHPYTRALIKAVPVADPTRERTPLPLTGEMPSALERPSGCVFRTRCVYATDICAEREPSLVEVKDGHMCACHLVERGEI
ncbi:MAG: ABC transporter ATP-binding protein [Thermoplasmata archaeon]|nr:ABC transporter ATP-binding protein [Thermoplasmata archaeon]